MFPTKGGLEFLEGVHDMLMHFGGVSMFQVVWESHLFKFVSIKIEREQQYRY